MLKNVKNNNVLNTENIPELYAPRLGKPYLDYVVSTLSMASELNSSVIETALGRKPEVLRPCAPWLALTLK